MESFILHIFPSGSLSISVVTTVWLGVWVVVFFNLRLGWVLSGLVVPGYLVPLILVKPWSAALVVVEGGITYFLVWLYSEKISRVAGYTNFFGRDRFFALLLASVIVRVCCDVFILPAAGEYLNNTFSLNFDYRNNLHSFGLIVIALIANQFWKPGFRRGIIVLFVTVFITFCLVRYIVIPYTNFSIGNLAYMYEDLAASMLAGPKAYIVLLTTAFLASRLNLRYGWEFSGILIPALLALEWYQPVKLLVTFLETFIILIIASQLLKAPVFKRTTMEGARKLLFFFNISFFYKLLMGHVIINYFPQYHISDFYGFGYLLSTLLAIKMHDKEIVAMVTRASLQTSLLSLFAATAIGFSLGFVPNLFSVAAVESREPAGFSGSLNEERTLADLLRNEQVLAYKTVRRNTVESPLAEEIDIFREALRLLKKYKNTKQLQLLEHAVTLFGRLDYQVYEIEGEYQVLREREPKRGWGTYIVNLGTDKKIQVQVPDPLGEWGTNFAGLTIFKMFNCESLAVAGSRRKANDDGSADVLTSTRTFFYVFQQVFGQQEILQIRALTDQSQEKILGQGSNVKSAGTQKSPSLLMINRSFPVGLELARLKEEIGFFHLLWQPAPYNNKLRDNSIGSVTEFFLTREDRRNLLFKPLATISQPPLAGTVQTVSGELSEWLMEHKGNLAGKGSELYHAPTLEKLLYWDKEILTPLLQVIGKRKAFGELSNSDKSELAIIKNSALALGYSLLHFQQYDSSIEYLILAEDENVSPLKYWGTYIFRLGAAKNFLVEVPRPLSERNVFEHAISLSENLEAEGLLISGTHSLANLDGSADVIKEENKGNFFNLANQIILRESRQRKMLVVHCRAFASVADENSPDALIANHSGIPLNKTRSQLIEEVEQLLVEQYQFKVRHLSGLASEAGYEVGGIAQVAYLDQSENKEFINLWLSPAVRSTFRQQTENQRLKNHFEALQIPVTEADLYSYLVKEHTPADLSANLSFFTLQNLIAEYVGSKDILALQKILLAQPAITFEQIIDRKSRQAFLIALIDKDHPIIVANLNPLRREPSYRLVPAMSYGEFRRFLDSRAMFLTTLERL